MKIFKVTKHGGKVDSIVALAIHKSGEGFSFVNLTKGHISPCVFDTEEEAIRDMNDVKTMGFIDSYIDITQEYNKTQEGLQYEG